MISPVKSGPQSGKPQHRDEHVKHQHVNSQRSGHHAQRTMHSSRATDKQWLSRNEGEFNRLLNDSDSKQVQITAPAILAPDALLNAPQETHSGSSLPAATLWQSMEPQLSQQVITQESFPAHFSLMLPQMGEVKARVNRRSGGGMDIALGFSPSLLNSIRGSEAQCEESLSRRMGEPVALQFNTQDAMS